MPMSQAHTLSVSINLNSTAAYAFLCQPQNFPKWASGLCMSIKQVDDEWIAETPQGPLKVRFTAPNDFGVLDHYVIPAPGVEIYVPMRVIANGTGCELVFTLFRQPDMSDAKFAEDIAWVERDLTAVKALLEA
jgi:hypothetical protein